MKTTRTSSPLPPCSWCDRSNLRNPPGWTEAAVWVCAALQRTGPPGASGWSLTSPKQPCVCILLMMERQESDYAESVLITAAVGRSIITTTTKCSGAALRTYSISGGETLLFILASFWCFANKHNEQQSCKNFACQNDFILTVDHMTLRLKKNAYSLARWVKWWTLFSEGSCWTAR